MGLDNISALRQFLQDRAAVMRTIHSHSDWKYRGFDELVLDCGFFMEPQPLPANLKPGLPKNCYYNCQQLAFKRNNLIYVEGYAISSNVAIPVPHAWLLSDKEVAIDPTWKTPGIAYLGVPLKTEWVKSILSSRSLKGRGNDLSIFEGNYLEDYFLLKQGLSPGASLKRD